VKSGKSSIAALGIAAVAALTAPAVASAAPAAVTASSASAAVEPCAAGWLCLYGSTGYVNMKFQTQRHGHCWNLADYGLVNSVYSYDNNLTVYAHFYNSAGVNVWNIRNGGSSADSTQWAGEYRVCTD
jgi:hypothetical protein